MSTNGMEVASESIDSANSEAVSQTDAADLSELSDIEDQGDITDYDSDSSVAASHDDSMFADGENVNGLDGLAVEDSTVSDASEIQIVDEQGDLSAVSEISSDVSSTTEDLLSEYDSDNGYESDTDSVNDSVQI